MLLNTFSRNKKTRNWEELSQVSGLKMPLFDL